MLKFRDVFFRVMPSSSESSVTDELPLLRSIFRICKRFGLPNPRQIVAHCFILLLTLTI